jgi:hypothetical protein
MRYDFVEIGCSDHDTVVQDCSAWMDGISVEPVSCYLQRLPRKPWVRLIAAAIGEVASRGSMFFQRRETVAKHCLPQWICGCNRLGEPHPTVLKLLAERGLRADEVIEQEEVRVMTFEELCDENSIGHIGYLKCDMEGMDIPILLHNLELLSDLDVDKIEFEYNELGDSAKFAQLHCGLEAYGYIRRVEYQAGCLYSRRV